MELFIHIIGFIIKNILNILFFDLFLVRKRFNHIVLYCHICFVSVLFTLLLPHIENSLILKFVSSLCIVSSFIIYYKGSINAKIISLISYIILTILSEILSGILLMPILKYNIFSLSLFNTIQILLTSLIIFFILNIVKKIFRVEKIFFNKRLILILYPLTTILMLYTLFDIVFSKNQNSISIYLLCIVSTIFLILSNIVLIFILKIIAKEELYEQKNLFNKELQFTHTQHKNDLLQLYRSVIKSQHDTKATYLYLFGLINSNKLKECKKTLENLLKDIENYKHIVNTGYDGLDAILSSKLDYARKQNIDLHISVFIPSKKFITIDEYDIAIVCANVIDNAIDAKNNFSGSNYSIHFRMEYETVISSLVITCKNPIDNYNYNINLQTFKTSKNDILNHGFGLENIKQIVNKWNGMFYNSYSNGFYKIIITFPNNLEV